MLFVYVTHMENSMNNMHYVDHQYVSAESE